MRFVHAREIHHHRCFHFLAAPGRSGGISWGKTGSSDGQFPGISVGLLYDAESVDASWLDGPHACLLFLGLWMAGDDGGAAQ